MLHFLLQATDADLPPNNIISFSIYDGDPLHNFTIHNETGQITLRNPLDYEAMDPEQEGIFYMRVMARDGGTPSLSTFTNLTIFVQVTTYAFLSSVVILWLALQWSFSG